MHSAMNARLSLAALCGLVLAAGLLLWAAPATHGGPETAWAVSHEPTTRSIGDKLQCPVCDGTSVSDSRSQIAEDMREIIRTKLAAGESESEIISFFVDSYGQGVLREPPTTGLVSAVWYVPGVALLFGAAIIYGVIRSRRQPVPATPGRPSASPAARKRATALSPSELERYRERLRDLEQGGP